MSQIWIRGGRRLQGCVELQGSKNGVLPMLAAVILHPGVTVLDQVPDIEDVRVSVDILRYLGGQINYDGQKMIIDARNMEAKEIPRSLGERMRSSVLFLGALLARFGEAALYRPGGCAIGSRPVNLHLDGLRKLGASLYLEENRIRAEADNLHPAEIFLAAPSVGATEQLILAASGVKGTVVLRGCAREPEIGVLCDFLNGMDIAKIRGAGSSELIIEGKGNSRDSEFPIPGDRIAAGTYLAAAAITGGMVQVRGARAEDMDLTLHLFRRMGCELETGNDFVSLKAPERLKAVKTIQTAPFPGFPTDMQSFFLAMHALADGSCVIEENIFESRLAMAEELNRMGAEIRVEGRRAYVCGVPRLYGAHITGRDLRSSAALTAAALAAEGESVLSGYEHAERGYVDFACVLRGLGAEIEIL